MKTSGVRFGAPALTTRGATPDHLRRIAAVIHGVAEAVDRPAELRRLRRDVEAIAAELDRI
jgi:glycine/serine hydroxymethyltransferase